MPDQRAMMPADTARRGADDGVFVHDIVAIDPADIRRFGGKATGLARMAAAGLVIPPAFVIDTDAFRAFRAGCGVLSPALLHQVGAAMARLQAAAGKLFAAGAQASPPLLVAVRSGAAISMPGMMDTILNLGLDSAAAASLAALSGNPGFVVDTWTRFWRMFAETVLGLDATDLAERVEPAARAARAGGDAAAFAALEGAILAALRHEGEAIGPSPQDHLLAAIAAVFRSWDSPRAVAYRKHHAIPDDLGTAVTIQAMVFGNLDDRSGSGVAFTRDPNTGAATLYGEYLTGRQGEDLVAGTHTPIDLADPQGMAPALREALLASGRQLERLYADAVDIEFTVEAGRLYLLQVRAAKRTAAAALRIAVDLVDEAVLTPAQALDRLSAEQLRRLLRPVFDPVALAQAPVLAHGLGSSPGQAHGAAVLDADRAAERVAAGEAVILIRPTTSPQDIRGMLAAGGIVTARGGALSHAAVVSRALDKPCIVGCQALEVDPAAGRFTVNGQVYAEGAAVSIDGTTGRLYAGAVLMQGAGTQMADVERLLGWADAVSGATIWAAPRAPADIAEAARGRPAGIGVAALADLLIAAGQMDRFVVLLGVLGDDAAGAAVEAEISALVGGACAPALAALDGLPIHIRLPRVSSDRARRLVANWGELHPRLFLPLGSAPYYRAILRGLHAVAGAAPGIGVTALLPGITGPAELVRFRDEVAGFGTIGAGAMIQNLAALEGCAAMRAAGVPLWIDLREIIRSAYGLPSEVVEAPGVLRDYAARGCIAVDPMTALGPLLRGMLGALGAAPDGLVRIDATGCPPDLVRVLFGLGFRSFSVQFGHRNETRLELGQAAARG